MAKRNLRQSVAEALEIPDEVALNSARIVITGERQLSVENHRGIIEYLPGKIVFKTAAGLVEVLGEDLTLEELTADNLSIEGNLMALCLVREGEANEPR